MSSAEASRLLAEGTACILQCMHKLVLLCVLMFCATPSRGEACLTEHANPLVSVLLRQVVCACIVHQNMQGPLLLLVSCCKLPAKAMPCLHSAAVWCGVSSTKQHQLEMTPQDRCFPDAFRICKIQRWSSTDFCSGNDVPAQQADRSGLCSWAPYLIAGSY